MDTEDTQVKSAESGTDLPQATTEEAQDLPKEKALSDSGEATETSEQLDEKSASEDEVETKPEEENEACTEADEHKEDSVEEGKREDEDEGEEEEKKGEREEVGGGGGRRPPRHEEARLGGEGGGGQRDGVKRVFTCKGLKILRISKGPDLGQTQVLERPPTPDAEQDNAGKDDGDEQVCEDTKSRKLEAAAADDNEGGEEGRERARVGGRRDGVKWFYIYRGSKTLRISSKVQNLIAQVQEGLQIQGVEQARVQQAQVLQSAEPPSQPQEQIPEQQGQLLERPQTPEEEQDNAGEDDGDEEVCEDAKSRELEAAAANDDNEGEADGEK